MAALTQERDTLAKRGDSKTFPVAEDAVIYQGSLVCLDATGFAIPGEVATGLVSLGRACNTVTGPADGYAVQTYVVVETSNGDKEFLWANSIANPLDQSDVGRDCYVEDDQTVSSNSSGTSVAGKVLGFGPDGTTSQVWVRHPV